MYTETEKKVRKIVRSSEVGVSIMPYATIR